MHSHSGLSKEPVSFLGKPSFSDIMLGMSKKFEQTMAEMSSRFQQSMQSSIMAQMEIIKQSNKTILETLNSQLKKITASVPAKQQMEQEQTEKAQNLNQFKPIQQNSNFLNKLQTICEKVTTIQAKIHSNDKQSRSKTFYVDLDPIPPKQKGERAHCLKRTASKIITQVFSVGFNLFYKQKVDFEKVKVYCCQNFLYSICNLVKKYQLQPSQLQLIDKHLQDKVIPFLKLNYPYSEQQQACRELVTRVVEYDRFNENQFDIVYRSGVQISNDPDDIDKEVMQILNYVIGLPDQPIKNEEKQFKKDTTLFTAFEHDFTNLFRKVQNRQWTNYFFNASQNLDTQITKPENLVEIENKISEMLKTQDANSRKQAQQYKEKVNSYTHYKLGRKLSANIEKFSQKQISQGVLRIKDFAVARVLTKWIELLEQYFEKAEATTYDRQQAYRLHDGSQIYEFPRIKFSSEMLTKRCKSIKDQLKLLTQNLYSSLHKVSNDTGTEHFKKLREICSDLDSCVGHMSTVIVQSGENYVCNYLKFLLAKVKEVQEQFFDKEEYAVSKTRNFLPALVNFKLGDLMRCLVTSKQREIIALYQYIRLQCKLRPDVYDMVRVKNRFNGPNKDILINIFYRKSIMIEIQLAIKNQSSFLACSDKFNHFIYELGRVPFGPISELCNVWVKYSPKSKYLQKRFKELNVSRYDKIKSSIPQCLNAKDHHYSPVSKNNIKMPYWCTLCQVFRCSGPKNQMCHVCKKIKRCLSCKKIEEENLLIQQRFDQYEKLEQNSFPEHGTLLIGIDLNADKIMERDMIVIDINQVYYLLSVRAITNATIKINQVDYDNVQLSEFKIEHKVSNLQKIEEINMAFKKYLQNFLLLKTNLNPHTVTIVQQTINRFWIKNKMINAHKDSKKTFNIQLKSKTMQKLKIAYKIDNPFNENIKFLQKVQKVIIHRDLLNSYPISMSSLLNLKTLFIGSNSIKEIDLKGLVNLSELTMNQNLISSFNFINGLSQLNQLAKIYLLNNKLMNCRGLPALPNLQVLEIPSNRVASLGDKFVAKNYPRLKTINLKNNKIEDFESLKNLNDLQSLRKLDLSGNSFQSLEKIPELSGLEELDLRKNMFKSLRGIQRVKGVKILNLSSNKLADLEGLDSLQNLTELYLQYCIHLNSLKKLSDLKSLKKINFFQNRICDLEPLKNHTELEYLVVGNRIGFISG